MTLLCILENNLSSLRIIVVKDGLMDSRDQSVKGNTLVMYFCSPLLLMHSWKNIKNYFFTTLAKQFEKKNSNRQEEFFFPDQIWLQYKAYCCILNPCKSVFMSDMNKKTVTLSFSRFSVSVFPYIKKNGKVPRDT